MNAKGVVQSVSTGVSYAVAYFAVEIAASIAVTVLLGVDATFFRLVGRGLLGLLLQYCVLGAFLGLLLHPLVRWLAARVWMPRFVGRRGLWYGLLTLTFIGLAYAWNVESVLPRIAYLEQAIAADVVIAMCLAGRFGFRKIAGWAGVPRRSWVTRVAVGLPVLVGIGALGYVFIPQRHSGGSRAISVNRTAGRSPNVLVIVVDTLRHDHLSTYGYTRPTSPNIDRIASSGVVFEQAFSPAPWTLPAHASLFTGLYPASHRADSGETRLDTSLPTLAGALQAGGYRTASFVANPWVTAATGLDRGFERVEFFGADALTGSSFVSLARERLAALLNLSGTTDAGGRELTAHLVDWMKESRASGQPFFAFANYLEAHEPFGAVPDPYFRSYLDEPLSPTIGRKWLRDTPLLLCSSCSPKANGPSGDGDLMCVDGRWRVSQRRQTATTALYDAGIRYVDDQIGALHDALEQMGILEDTLFVVTSDHGESLGEHDFLGHGALLYSQLLHVPLVVRYPRAFAAGIRIDTPVSLLDIFPTVQEIAGLPPLPGLPGNSLRDLGALSSRPSRVYAEKAAVPEAVWRAMGVNLDCDYSLAGRRLLSLQTPSLKYIWSSDGQTELYDVTSDPGETHNLAKPRRDEAGGLEKDLFSWLSKVESASDDRKIVPIDPATRKRLESLGYIR